MRCAVVEPRFQWTTMLCAVVEHRFQRTRMHCALVEPRFETKTTIEKACTVIFMLVHDDDFTAMLRRCMSLNRLIMSSSPY